MQSFCENLMNMTWWIWQEQSWFIGFIRGKRRETGSRQVVVMAALRVNLQTMNVCLVETSLYVCLQVVLMHQSWEATATYVFSWPSFHMIQPRCHQIPMQLRRSCPSLRDRSSRYDLTQTPLEDRIPHNSAYFLKPPAALILQKKNCPSVPKAKYINIHTYMFTPLTTQVHGDKDPDGFYRGECGGRLGYVPCNMVSEIQVDDEETRQQLLQQGFLSTAGSMEKIGRWKCLNKN